jgi:aquaporin Z
VNRSLAVIRLILGFLQMAGAVASLLLFLRIGFAPIVIWVWSVTTVFFVTSVVLFRVLRLQDNAGVDFQFMKKYFAEFVGTFALVFAGTGAIVINEVSGGVITHVGVALTFGLIVLAMIYTIGDISGAHINPAVTLGFFTARRFAGKQVLPFIAAQCAGALLASAILHFLFPQNATLGATLPAGPAMQSFVLETILTGLLMLAVLSVSTGAKEKGMTAGIAIGSVIALEAMFAGPICGASMNPARSLAPALVSGHLNALWIYLLAPITGAVIGVLCCRCVREDGCCAVARPR